MAALSHLVGIVTACILVTALEQATAWLLRRVLITRLSGRLASRLPDNRLRDKPLARYTRTLVTPGNSDLRWVRAGLLFAGLAAWLSQAVYPALLTLAIAAWLIALAWDLWASQTVSLLPDRLVWRHGLQHSARSLRLAQVAEVYVVERPGRGFWCALVRTLGLPVGTAYLAVELHNGRAAKLPRTDRWLGVRHLRHVAQRVRQRQQVAALERHRALDEEQAARRRVPRLLPDPVELALKRELMALRRRGQQPQGAPNRLPESRSAGLPARVVSHFSPR